MNVLIIFTLVTLGLAQAADYTQTVLGNAGPYRFLYLIDHDRKQENLILAVNDQKLMTCYIIDWISPKMEDALKDEDKKSKTLAHLAKAIDDPEELRSDIVGKKLKYLRMEKYFNSIEQVWEEKG